MSKKITIMVPYVITIDKDAKNEKECLEQALQYIVEGVTETWSSMGYNVKRPNVTKKKLKDINKVELSKLQ